MKTIRTLQRHWLLRGCAALLLLTISLTQERPSSANTQTYAARNRPNIVFIMSDDHAAQAISAYGSKLIKTPNIDRLAKEGMKFENCFVTNSICTPSRAVMRMPFLIRWPKQIKAGSVSQKMILNVDFAPTFLDAAGMKAPADMQGRSILPLLQGKTPKDWRTAMYYRYYHPGDHNVAAHYGIRTMRYKLIYYHKLDQWELYDLRKDRLETRNEYSNPAFSKIVASLKQEMYRLKKEMKDEDQLQDNLPQDDVDSMQPPKGMKP